MSPFTYSPLVVSACVPPTESVPVISVLPVTSREHAKRRGAPHLQGGGGLDVAVRRKPWVVSACVPPTERVPVISVLPVTSRVLISVVAPAFSVPLSTVLPPADRRIHHKSGGDWCRP